MFSLSKRFMILPKNVVNGSRGTISKKNENLTQNVKKLQFWYQKVKSCKKKFEKNRWEKRLNNWIMKVYDCAWLKTARGDLYPDSTAPSDWRLYKTRGRFQPGPCTLFFTKESVSILSNWRHPIFRFPKNLPCDCLPSPIKKKILKLMNKYFEK